MINSINSNKIKRNTAQSVHGKNEKKVNGSKSLDSVKVIDNSFNQLSLHYHPISNQLNYKKNIIIADSHRSSSLISVAHVLLKQLLMYTAKFKKLLDMPKNSSKEYYQFDQIKDKVIQIMNTKLFNQFVLDSSFKPVSSGGNWIAFVINGLDLNHSRLDEELITIYLNHKIITLMFHRLGSKAELLQQFSTVLGLHQIVVDVDYDNRLVFKIRDEIWRKWGGNVLISGQGIRFSDIEPESLQVKTIESNIDDFLRLDIQDNVAKEKLDKIIHAINREYQLIIRSQLYIDNQNEKIISKLKENVDMDNDLKKMQVLSKTFSSQPSRLLYYHHAISYHNAVTLLKR